MTNICTIMVGPSGTGKTTYVKEHFPNAVVLSADHYIERAARNQHKSYTEIWSQELARRANMECQKVFMEALNAGDPHIVVDNMNLRSRDRKFYMIAARSKGYKVELVVLPCEPQVSAGRNTHGLTLEHIERQHNAQKLPPGIYEYTDMTRFVSELPKIKKIS